MADRESLMNALIELECKPTTYSSELLRKKWAEALTTAEFDPCVRLDGRTARKELSVYDAMIAEICGEHDAEKAKVRNRRRADRKYKELPKERKYREEMRKDRLFGYCGNYDCPKVVGRPNSMMIADRKRINAESVMRSDWDAEYADIVEDIEWAFFDAEYCNEQIDIIERRDPLLENGNNYVRWNRMWEKINKYNEVIRKNRFAEELANEQFGFINWGEE